MRRFTGNAKDEASAREQFTRSHPGWTICSIICEKGERDHHVEYTIAAVPNRILDTDDGDGEGDGEGGDSDDEDVTP
jgi:hypothetical protein